MRPISIYLMIIMIFSVSTLNGQADLDPPVTPLLQLVSVDHTTGNVEITWSPSPSPDVSSYVVYKFINNEGYELDTIYDPAATQYLYNSSGSGYYSESFVIAAMDTAGNISPLSNKLSTIFASVQLDTCNKSIGLNWNSYLSVPKEVEGYRIFYSMNSTNFADSIGTGPDKTNITIQDFIVNAQYCFYINANLNGGYASGSNKVCLTTKMQRPPEWINADYATVLSDNEIQLSFTTDPLSEIRNYTIEKRAGNDSQFTKLLDITNGTGEIIYTDSKANTSINNYYRLKAINNCNNPVTVSNIASNIVLTAERGDDRIDLSWNTYKEWRGTIDSYKIFIRTGNDFEENYSLPSSDSSLTINYETLMYKVSRSDICFMVRAVETLNPYVASGQSNSQVICTPVTEKLFVPTVFTPDNNTVNDFFKPVLSFTPLSYRLLITNIKRKPVFDTIDFNESWDGTFNGTPQPEGVYLWFLTARMPSGKDLVRTGTVTIIHNR
jgi:hypothetical protein